MASFCTKCGAPLPSSTGFCPACGTPVAAGVVTPAPGFTPVPVPVPPAQPAPGYQATPGYSQVNPAGAPPAGYPPASAYPPQQQKSSGGALKIILIVVAVVVGLGVVVGGFAMYSVYRMAHAIKASVQTDDKGNSTVSVLGSTISAGKNVDISAADLGVPLYPGAARGEGGMHMTLPTMTMSSAVFTTGDPVSVVVAFYKGKLGENESDMDTDTGSVLSSGKDGPNGKNGIVITIAPGTGNTSGKTKISIVRTVSTAK
jgi:hypothetical protein